MSTIQETVQKIKSTVGPLYTLILLVVVASIFFALGRLSALEEEHTAIKMEQTSQVSSQNTNQTGAVVEAGIVDNTPQATVPAQTAPTAPVGGKITTPVVQSQPTPSQDTAGEVIGVFTSKKYYFPWCGVIKRVKPQNQIHFLSADLAKLAGYSAGGGCKGLQ